MKRNDANTLPYMQLAWQGQLPPADPSHVINGVAPVRNPYGPPGSRQSPHWRDLIAKFMPSSKLDTAHTDA